MTEQVSELNNLDKNYKVWLNLIPEWLCTLVDCGIEPTLFNHPDDGLVLDLKTGMKSHIYLKFHPDGRCQAYMRYNETHWVEDLNDLQILGREATHGRDYMSSGWSTFLNLQL